MAREQLWLGYQPILLAETDTVIGLEAVLRWEHPEYGMLNSDSFLPVAEDSGLIVPMGAWALRRACEDAMTWPAGLTVAVDVSPVQLAQPGFVRMVAAVLEDTGLDPARLELELAESICTGKSQVTGNILEDLKALGVRLVLDNFGAGASSLAWLRDAPFGRVKLSKTFVREATDPANRNHAMLPALVNLVAAMGLEALADGVESLDELALVRALGVTCVQGQLYSAPLASGEVLARLASGEWTIAPQGPAAQRAERKTILRRIGVIHDDHRYEVWLRNISKTGALIGGIVDVPLGTRLVLDLGEGQLAVGTVTRSLGASQGVMFETPLVDDGLRGLSTSNRSSQQMLAAASGSGSRINEPFKPRFATVDDRVRLGRLP